MSLLHRILPWRRSRAQRTWLAGESRATRDALGANIAGLAQAMEERFVSLAERIDASRAAQAAEAVRIAEALSERLDGALGGLRAALDARFDGVSAEIEALRDGQDFARVLRDLKRDLGAQISLSSFEAAAELRGLASGFEPGNAGRPSRGAAGPSA